jgi:hypothetical protein
MSDGSLNFPTRTTDPAAPDAGRIKLYNKNGTPYYVDENGLAKTLKGDAGLDTLPLVQSKNTSSPLLTTTPTDVPFETTQIETDSATLNHDDANRERLYAVVSAYYSGALNMSFTNSTIGQREIDVGIYLNGVTILSSICFKISANSDSLVTRTLFLPEVPANSYFTVKMSCDANNAVTFNATSGVTLMGTKGVVGPSGIDGADGDITWQGDWVAADYTANQAVAYLGSSYVCHLDTTAQQTPVETGYWNVLADKGDTGATGPAGAITESRVIASAPALINNASGLTTIDSMALAPPSGRHILNFTSQYSIDATGITAVAKIDIATLIADIEALPVTSSRALALGTETVNAGVYTIAGAGTGTAGATLTLDALGIPSALFVFRISSTFTTGIGFSVALAGGANPNNVFFLVSGTTNTGSTTSQQGTVISKTGQTLGANGAITGRFLTLSGAMTISSTVITKPSLPSDLPMASLEDFAIFTGAGAITNSLTSNITGDIGTDAGAITGLETSTVDGNVYTSASQGATVNVGVYIDDVLESNTARVIIKKEDVDGDNIVLSEMVTTTTGQVIDVKLDVAIGSITVGNRSLTAIKVGA